MKTADMIRKILNQAHSLSDSDLLPLIKLIDYKAQLISELTEYNDFMFKNGNYSVNNASKIGARVKSLHRKSNKLLKLLNHIKDSENVYKDLP